MVYGKHAIKQSSVFEWHRQFKERQKDVPGDTSSGQPKTQRKDANMNSVCIMVRSDQRLSVQLIAELNMKREILGKILTEDLGMKNVSSKILLQILIDGEKQC